MAERPSFRRFVPLIIGGVVVLGVTGALVWVIVDFMKAKPEQPQRQTAQIVKLIRPPPPPPEPPPPPPPPEEKIEEPLEQQTPEDAPPDESAPAESLGLDADGVAGSDGFGLAARRGGREIGLGSAFGWYTTMLKDSILDVLSEDERVRRGSYQVTVRVWLSKSGEVERIRLATTTGDRELDAAIESRLQRMGKVREAPPLEMPQPVTLRIVSRG